MTKYHGTAKKDESCKSKKRRQKQANYFESVVFQLC